MRHERVRGKIQKRGRVNEEGESEGRERERDTRNRWVVKKMTNLFVIESLTPAIILVLISTLRGIWG